MTSIRSWVVCCANTLPGRRCLRNRASAPSWLLACCSAGPIPEGSATRQRSPRSPVSLRSRPVAGSEVGTVSTEAETAH